jgi:L-fuconolactonase
MEALRRDFLPADLAPLLAEHQIQGTVAVQARQDLDETRWLLSLADQMPFVMGVVGWVDLSSEELDAQLDEFCAHRAFKGVRHVVQDELDPRFLLRQPFLEGVAKLARRGLVYDILIYPPQLPVATQFVDALPDQRFVLDHLAKPCVREKELQPWSSFVRELARRDNVVCKVSGLVTEAEWGHWSVTDFVPYLDVALEAFGHRRLMFGSDWPVCTLAGDYGQVKDVLDVYAAWLSEHERDALYGGNAARFYDLPVT